MWLQQLYHQGSTKWDETFLRVKWDYFRAQAEFSRLNNQGSDVSLYHHLSPPVKALVRMLLYDHVPESLDASLPDLVDWFVFLHQINVTVPKTYYPLLNKTFIFWLNQDTDWWKVISQYVLLPPLFDLMPSHTLDMICNFYRIPVDLNESEQYQHLQQHYFNTPDGLYGLAWAQEHGRGVVKDLSQALTWYDQNWQQNQHGLSLRRFVQLCIQHDMVPQDIEWYWMNWQENHHADSLYEYANCLIDQAPVPDTYRARQLYWMNWQENRHADSLYEYANCLRAGEGGPHDLPHARQLYWMGWEQTHHSECLLQYCGMLECGLGGPKDKTTATELNWLNWVECRNPTSLYYYALSLQATQEYTKARHMHWMNWEQTQYEGSLDEYVCLLLQGQGGERDVVQAKALYVQYMYQGPPEKIDESFQLFIKCRNIEPEV